MCETGKYRWDISTKAGDLITGLLSSRVDDIPNLSQLQTSDFLARLSLKALALAWPEVALAWPEVALAWPEVALA